MLDRLILFSASRSQCFRGAASFIDQSAATNGDSGSLNWPEKKCFSVWSSSKSKLMNALFIVPTNVPLNLISNQYCFLNSIGEMLPDPIVPLPTVASCRVVTSRDSRQLLSSFPITNGSKGISALYRNLSLYVLESVNMDTHHTHAIVPRLDYFVVDPFPSRRICANKNNGAGSAVHLGSDPLSYCCVTVPLYGFPVVVCCRTVAFYGANVSHLSRTPIVEIVMKTIEYSALHYVSPLVLRIPRSASVTTRRAP